MKLLLLDLDGTVRGAASGATFINTPYDQVILLGVQAALDNYKDWTKVGITNQLGVSKGYKTLEDCIAEQKYTMELLSIELQPNEHTKHKHYQLSSVYFCPDEGDTCHKVYCGSVPSMRYVREEMNETVYDSFRKPGTGMIQLAMYSFYGEPIDDVLFVGDRTEDYEAATKSNIPFKWAKDWWQL